MFLYPLDKLAVALAVVLCTKIVDMVKYFHRIDLTEYMSHQSSETGT